MSKNQKSVVCADASTSACFAGVDCISLGTACPICQVSDMDQGFLQKLLIAQQMYGKKFRINSAYRSVAWEKQKGRSGRSSHCKGIAVDISAVSHFDRMFIVAALLLAGFRRIGIAKTFIHCDDDSSKSSSMWLYDPADSSKTF